MIDKVDFEVRTETPPPPTTTTYGLTHTVHMSRATTNPVATSWQT